jgi:hypothetical protein
LTSKLAGLLGRNLKYLSKLGSTVPCLVNVTQAINKKTRCYYEENKTRSGDGVLSMEEGGEDRSQFSRLVAQEKPDDTLLVKGLL